MVDAVDTVTAKLQLVEEAREKGVPVISSMGAGNKLDAAGFEIADIYATSVCPLAKVMRYELKKRNIKDVPVLFSEEIPIDLSTSSLEQKLLNEENSVKHQIPGSISFVPSIAGLLIARYVILKLIER